MRQKVFVSVSIVPFDSFVMKPLSLKTARCFALINLVIALSMSLLSFTNTSSEPLSERSHALLLRLSLDLCLSPYSISHSLLKYTSVLEAVLHYIYIGLIMPQCHDLVYWCTENCESIVGQETNKKNTIFQTRPRLFQQDNGKTHSEPVPTASSAPL